MFRIRSNVQNEGYKLMCNTIARPPRFCLIFTNQKRLCKACDDEEVGIAELNLI